MHNIKTNFDKILEVIKDITLNSLKVQHQNSTSSFTQRELEVIKLLSVGKLNKEIAYQLNISINTVKKFNKQIFKKVGFARRVQVAQYFTEQIRA